MARPVGHPMGLLQAGGGACARWGGSVISFSERDAEHVRAGLVSISAVTRFYDGQPRRGGSLIALG